MTADAVREAPTELGRIIAEMREASDRCAESIETTRLQNRLYLWADRLAALAGAAPGVTLVTDPAAMHFPIPAGFMPHAPAKAREDVEDATEPLMSRMEGWAKAYPEPMFSEPTDEEREWLHATRPGLMGRIAASMGRHMAKCIADDLTTLRAALATFAEGAD